MKTETKYLTDFSKLLKSHVINIKKKKNSATTFSPQYIHIFFQNYTLLSGKLLTVHTQYRWDEAKQPGQINVSATSGYWVLELMTHSLQKKTNNKTKQKQQ